MKKLVLLAEDDEILRGLIERSLIEAGFDVACEGDGVQATLKAKEIKPDVMILDVQLPGAYGFSVYASLQQDTDTAGIPVLFISGALIEEAFHKRIPEGSRTKFLAKPFGPNEAVTAVKELLGL